MQSIIVENVIFSRGLPKKKLLNFVYDITVKKLWEQSRYQLRACVSVY